MPSLKRDANIHESSIKMSGSSLFFPSIFRKKKKIYFYLEGLVSTVYLWWSSQPNKDHAQLFDSDTQNGLQDTNCFQFLIKMFFFFISIERLDYQLPDYKTLTISLQNPENTYDLYLWEKKYTKPVSSFQTEKKMDSTDIFWRSLSMPESLSSGELSINHRAT